MTASHLSLPTKHRVLVLAFLLQVGPQISFKPLVAQDSVLTAFLSLGIGPGLDLTRGMEGVNEPFTSNLRIGLVSGQTRIGIEQYNWISIRGPVRWSSNGTIFMQFGSIQDGRNFKLGLGLAEGTLYDSNNNPTITRSGVSITLGYGYYWKLSKHFSLTANADMLFHYYSSHDWVAHGAKTNQLFFVTVGATYWLWKRKRKDLSDLTTH